MLETFGFSLKLHKFSKNHSVFMLSFPLLFLHPQSQRTSDFLGRYTVLSGCGLGAGLADKQAREGEVAGSSYK